MMHYDLVISVEVNFAFNLTSTSISCIVYEIIQVNFLRISFLYEHQVVHVHLRVIFH